jgi:rod shape-determining protein MreC
MRDNRRTRVVLAVLLLTAFTLLTLDIRGGSGSGLRGLGQRVFGPVERAAAAVARPIGDFFDGLTNISSNQAKIAALTAENERLQQEVDGSASDQRRIAELDALLRVAGLGQYRTVPARVVAFGPAQGFAWTVTVDAGTRDGVRADMTVINGQGLVGRVISAGPSSSTVLLLVDPTFDVGARMAGSGEIGNVTGQGRAPLELEVFNQQAQLRSGDQVVTLGVNGGRPFVPGVPIGTVTQVKPTPGALSRTAFLAPYVNFTALDLVGIVIQPPRTNPRDSVLPPVPSPSPTASAGASATPGATTSPGTTPSPGGSPSSSSSP